MTDPSLNATPADLAATDDGGAIPAPIPSNISEIPCGELLMGDVSVAGSLPQELHAYSPAPAMGSLPTADGLSMKVNLPYRVGFFLASTVGGLSSVCIKQLLLPIQVSQLDPRTTATSFALIASLGACAGLIAAPLSGALSDRTISRWGRRRPWMIGGTMLAVIGLLVMAQARTLLLLLLGEILAQVGVDSLLATTTSLIPDRMPEGSRTGLSVLNGMAPIVGGVLGLVLVTRLTNPNVVWQSYSLLAVVSACFMVLFLLILREPSLRQYEAAPFRWRIFLTGFVRPLAYRDFACVLLSRTLVFLSFTMLGTYTFFYLSQVVRMTAGTAAQGVATLQLISTGMLVAGALGTGFAVQRMRRLKTFLVGGALLMAVGLSIMALFPIWSVLLLAAAIFGSGFGAFIGLDIVMAVRVLPKATEQGKDLGILHTAIFLALMMSPVMGAVILNTVHSFVVLFLLAALSSVLAAAAILPVKSVP